MSFILIQVKNYQDSIDSFSRIARETINPTVCGIMDEHACFPYASVYMQFGSKGKRNPVIEALPLHEQQYRQDSNGISIKVYTEDELKSLNMYQIGLAAIYPCLGNTGHASKSPARIMNGRKGSNENAAVRRYDASFWDQISNE